MISSMIARISSPSGSPERSFSAPIGSSVGSPTVTCVCVAPVPINGAQPLEIARRRRLDDLLAHAPNRFRHLADIVDHLDRLGIILRAGRRIGASGQRACRSAGRAKERRKAMR
jgi:hypothetical protein